MTRPILDPTAGQRAREIWLHPAAGHRIPDPTSPRYGETSLDASEQVDDARQIFDPTDPECGSVWS